MPRLVCSFQSYTEAPWHHAGDTEIKLPGPALIIQWGRQIQEDSTSQTVRGHRWQGRHVRDHSRGGLPEPAEWLKAPCVRKQAPIRGGGRVVLVAFFFFFFFEGGGERKAGDAMDVQ